MADSFQVIAAPDEFTIVDNNEDWVLTTRQDTTFTLVFEAVAMNDAAVAVAAKVLAEAAAVLTAADRVQTGLDVAATNANVLLTAADASDTAADRVQTGLDRAQTAIDRVAVAADRVQTGLDVVATAADRVQTGLDVAATNADVVQTGLDVAATAANVVLTAADVVAAQAAATLAMSVIPTGGTIGQVLAKASNADYDYQWLSAGGTGDMTKLVYDPTNINSSAFDRVNHTGTQLAATISDFSTAADARVSAAIGVTVQAYSAVLAATTASYTTALNTKLNGIATGATANDTDANLKARANHTGTQLAATISDFSTAADLRITVTSVGTTLAAATAKTTPVDADTMPLSDSAASNVMKKVTWANIKATLKTYFDTFYQPVLATLTAWGAITRASGFDTFVATPSSANLRALLTDEVGTGAAYFVGGALGTPASGTLTNATGLPLGGLVASTALAIGVGSVELGHATDTTLSRSAAGKMAVEGIDVVLLSGAQSLSSKTLVDPVITGTITEDVFGITDAAAFVVNPRNGSIQAITLGANRTPVPSGWVNGDSVTLLIADGSAFTITWTGFPIVWKGATAPTLATTGYTEVNITYEGGQYRGVTVGDFAS